MRIGPYQLDNPVILAPMAGVTDLPFRQLCKELGAGLTVSEMLSSNPRVWQTEKSQKRMGHANEPGIIAVQIAGCEPELMAAAAQHNVANGAQIIDINMGCPAKKVNKKMAGSALMQYPELVQEILHAVVAAVEIPVTLKIRTGWDPDHRNAIEIAQLAEQAGIQSLAVHGRTRACMYKGEAEYDTIRAVKQAVSLPVVANGDIVSPAKARQVLDYTGADAVMIGRGAQGNPWLFREIAHFLETGQELAKPDNAEITEVVIRHVQRLHEHYGEFSGVRIARKHVGWYLQQQQPAAVFRRQFVAIESANEQLDALATFFNSVN
ncbi:tRNA dihydrouridine synthase DusB [Pseudidiomarina terrestris]|uniref:tRNA-dihydrouridine synthase B n=1 Tax=Pseudidiomarina terrestris TaxID=2820060 RepID=A0AAW7QY00_9GAMM|nr:MULTISPECIES: tRNA dihydrouridine synthase DusB [unclassified Pseudidiomarina]MDN7125047.1 tRNA dihydrouridine synthase DusB [Pseudidiomarina sp. 1APP75-32.1]MDN7128198.1 tRNA dihydrouridine synthase DusB [Pseudidiomarina sp. 1APR75-33.1]MDN7129478.1 tRNA dihydrouridine synthase DusB [Pseudidiomarina sp. 1APR75-15]MDN7135794.1 tRNA dihydrouridine synthase DusB [Pseudidiomarina sp. 1ASP75-5]MDN7138262.1 tRNA dihydrouridine synthase DusB [Pseudidiomarina sp. 1ASP75-14]